MLMALTLSMLMTTAEGVAAFRESAKVLQHPRCLNCHPSGDRPTQGADLHVHTMNVQRGEADHGAAGLPCASCHGDANYAPSGVPGAPKWALAPRSMGWQGLNERELCEALKDPAKNHGMSLEALVKHSAEDPLVAWGWSPGDGREPAPGTQKEFGAHVAAWVEAGAPCP